MEEVGGRTGRRRRKADEAKENVNLKNGGDDPPGWRLTKFKLNIYIKKLEVIMFLFKGFVTRQTWH